jgi:predicted  nucleic acid-binding Zn-ribbon protein
VSEAPTLLQLHDLDLLLSDVSDSRSRAQFKRLGFEIGDLNALERARTRMVNAIDRRWLNHYERALRRYGRAVTIVRDRVCQGCFITLPTSASPSSDESLTVCESCGRILYWR